MSEENTRKKPKLWPIYILFLIISFATSIFAIYELSLLSSIENLIRYIVMGLLVLIDLFLFIRVKKIIKGKTKKKKKHIGIIFFMLLYSIICGAVGAVIFYIYGEVSSLNKVYVTYTSHLIVPAVSEVNKPSQANDLSIGILDDKSSVEGYKLPMEIVKKYNLEDDNELVEYQDYTSMIVDLYSGELDGCFVSGGYVDLFSNIAGYENIENDTKIIATKSKKMRKTDASKVEGESSGKNIKEPFTILLMGIDSTDEVLEKNAVANGDTLILITFNPKTLNATMLSIPRDSYVPIACWSDKAENKITHAAAYGNDCMINTIEDYFDVNIDYYAKINFKGFVKLIDAVGGVEIDVEQDLCTDDSNRTKEICINEGKQVLDGEHALVYARNRKQLVNGDFGRNYHQQIIVMALMDKIKEVKDVSTFMSILNTISNSMDTNFTTKQILSFYNVAKDILKKSMSSDEADLVNIERLYLQGSSQMIYDERARMTLYNYVPNQSSRKDIIQAMKENLELATHKDIKSFSFSINEPYEKEVIGYGPYKTEGSYNLMPDFTGDSQQQAQATCNKLSLRCTFVGSGGYVVSQNVPANRRLDKISSVTLTLSQSSSTTTETEKKSTTPKQKTIIEDEDDEEEEEKTTTKTEEKEEETTVQERATEPDE